MFSIGCLVKWERKGYHWFIQFVNNQKRRKNRKIPNYLMKKFKELTKV